MHDLLDNYNVTWNSPSTGPTGSMPLGNGDLALNIWTEPTGDLLLLIAKSDAWEENSINLKLGRIRIKFTPNPLENDAPFKQTLYLRTADIECVAGPITTRIWVDANQPVIHIEADSDEPFQMQATLEIWPTEPRQIKTQTGDIFKNLVGKNSDPHPTIIWPDQLIPPHKNQITWYHHNQKRIPDGYEINMKLQGLGEFISQMPHPLAGRTFGGAIEGDNFIATDSQTLQSNSALSHRLRIHALTLHPSTPDEWQKSLDQQIASLDKTEARIKHIHWWNEFWNRSWIYVTSDSPEESTKTFHITQSYILQRFMNAAAGRGPLPIKFNGSLFTVGQDDDPDFRRWGGPGFWFMNMRLIYWPMLAAGDFDLMLPWLQMYRKMLPLQKHRTQKYFNHPGAHYPETIMFWGAEVSSHYGWTPFEQRTKPEAESPYLTYYWSGGIELILILLEYFNYTGDTNFARITLIPIADEVLQFFNNHYPRDPTGKIRFEPAQSLETWHEATNPTPEIAGLKYLLPKLLDLPNDLVTASRREAWKKLFGELPPIPLGEKEGKKIILPAEKFDKKKNTENPELYCIFPYRLFGIGHPDLELARNTFAIRLHPSHDCWSQDEIQMALLGLTEQAADYLAQRASPASHSDSRFPAFWNAFHDWIPDMDHGGVLQLALQYMLVQPNNNKLNWLPAWPKSWNATFKLHLPNKKTATGKVYDGQLTDLKIQ